MSNNKPLNPTGVDKTVEGNRTPKSDKFKEGDKIICVKSQSCGYKDGKEYTVTKDDQGRLGVWADDGFFDLLSLLLSSFKKPDLERKLSVV